MASLKNIKLKILSYKKTGTVTHAMEAVSAVKMRKAQERAIGGRSYAAAALSVLERLSSTADVSRHPLMRPNKGKKGLIVVTSDKGLAGSLNSAVIRKAEQWIKMEETGKENLVIFAIGRRGADYFQNRGYEIRDRVENVSDDVSEADVRRITDLIIHLHRVGEIGECTILYQNFVSTFEQKPEERMIIPITKEMMRTMIAGIRPVRGKYAPQAVDTAKPVAAYTIEPDADSVLAELLPRLLNIALFHALLESKASEHSARMVAMKSATDKAHEMAHSYTRTFNKVRQAAITREVSEITSGIEAMR
ncbi:MAG TPA: ATP synthase F1 subunit gamma [Candidatus Paceibacterota bacterium]|nr:ATP synthase F1 subunit gamma [Candidatus Paceibacterota bacterium]